VKDTYALRDLVNLTRAGRRTIQFWADHGVLVADKGTDHAGTGTHRRFSRDEAIVACLIHAFALRQIGIGELIGISKMIREILADPESRKEINQAIIDEKSKTGLILETWNDKGPRYKVSLLPGHGPSGHLFKNILRPDGFAFVINLRMFLSRLDA
jgi:hypothetical protein